MGLSTSSKFNTWCAQLFVRLKLHALYFVFYHYSIMIHRTRIKCTTKETTCPFYVVNAMGTYNVVTLQEVAHTVYPKKYAHGFVVLCFVVVMQSFIKNSHEVFIHIHQGCFAGTGAIVRLPQCQWSKPDGYGKISQCITTTKHSKAKTVCIFLGMYCSSDVPWALRYFKPPATRPVAQQVV